MNISLSELEQAINYWRVRRPATGEERALSPEVNALATIYALLIFEGRKEVPVAALDPVAQQLMESALGDLLRETVAVKTQFI